MHLGSAIKISENEFSFPQFKSFLSALVLLGVFFLPFELLVLSSKLNAVLSFVGLGSAQMFFHPFIIMMLGLVGLVTISQPVTRQNLVKNSRFVFIVAGLMALGLSISFWVNDSNLTILWQRLFFLCCGLIGFYTLVFFFDLSTIVRTYFSGMALWMLVSLGLYFFYYHEMAGSHLFDVAMPLRFPLLRYPDFTSKVESAHHFFFFTGNVNKVSNLAIVNLLLCGLFRKSLRPVLFYPVLALSSALIFVTFSRGTMAMAGFCAVVLLLAALYTKSKKHLATAFFLVLPLILSLSTADLRHYWRDTSSLVQRYQILNDLFAQESTMQKKMSGEFLWKGQDLNWKTAATGMGPGGFAAKFDLKVGDSHNLFVDSWLDAGLFGVIAISLLFIAFARALYTSQGLRDLLTNEKKVYLACFLIAVLALSFREYSLLFLNIGTQTILQFCLFLAIGKSIQESDSITTSPQNADTEKSTIMFRMHNSLRG